MPSSSSTRSTVLRNCLTRMISPKVESCCGCCSLKVGVLFTALLFLVNASLAFAGEAALYLGMLSAISSTAVGEYLPPGTKIEPSYGLQGGLIALGLYALLGFLFGTIGVIRKNYRLITIFYIMTAVDAILGIFIGVLAWFTGMPFSALLSQIPTFIINIYLLVVIKSYRESLRSTNTSFDLDEVSRRMGNNNNGSSKQDGDIETGVNEDDIDIDDGDDQRTKPTVTKNKKAPVIEIGQEDDEDDNDGDITANSSHYKGNRK